MKLFSVPSELKTIRSICTAKEAVAGLLLASVTESSFHYNPALMAYRRILHAVRKDGNIPDYVEICSDPGIPEEARKILLKSDEQVVATKEKAQSVIKTLEKYRQLRGLVQLFDDGFKALDSDKVDVEKVIDDVSDALSNVRSKTNIKKSLIHIGKGNNSAYYVKKILRGKKAPVMPTGFKAYDDLNGGIPYGALWLIGATTGGGKSTVALNIAINGTMVASEDAALVSLEMTDEETIGRYLANRTGIDLSKFVQYKLAKGEKRLVKKAYTEHVTQLKKQETRFSIYSPDEDVSIEDVLLMLKPYGYRVIIIDYISLLRGADSEDMWRQLGKIARFSKIFAKTTNTIVVLLCQINEEGAARYSKAIVEHANNCLIGDTWIETKQGLIKLKDLNTRHYVHTGSNSIYVRPEKVWKVGRSPVYELFLEKGRVLTGTKEHKLFCIEKNGLLGWKSLGKLTSDDYVSKPKLFIFPKTNPNIKFISPSIKYVQQSINGKNRPYLLNGNVPKKLTIDLALLLGLFLGDGYLAGKDTIGYCSKDKELINEFSRILTSVFNLSHKINERENKFYSIVIFSKLLYSFLYEFCYTHNKPLTSSYKKVPNFMYLADKESAAAFLRGLYSTDGYGGGSTVGFHNTSKILVDYVYNTTQKFGIVNSRSIRKATGKSICKNAEGKKIFFRRDLYGTGFAGYENIRIFEEQIGFAQKRKGGIKKTAFIKTEMLPISVSKRIRSLGITNLPRAQFGIRRDSIYDKQFMSTIKAVDKKLWETLETIKKENIGFEKVIGKKYIGKRDVYDVSINKYHSFVANGLRVHNCWFWTMTQESRESGIIEIKQEKARNQNPAPFSLKIDFPTMRVSDVDVEEHIDEENSSKSEGDLEEEIDDL